MTFAESMIKINGVTSGGNVQTTNQKEAKMKVSPVIGLLLGIVAFAAALTSIVPPGTKSAGWNGIFNLSDDGLDQYMGYGYQHTVAADTGGNVHVVWYDSRTGTNQVFYRRWSRSTGEWGSIVQVTNQTPAAYRPAVVCDHSGNVHVVWYHSAGTGTYGIWYKKWNVATETWEDSLQLYYPGGNYLNYYPSIACRPNGDNIHVVWYGRDASNPTNFRIRHMEYTPGVGWSAMSIIDPFPGDSNIQASVAVDQADSVYVVWRKRVSGYYQIFYTWRNGAGVWRTVEQVSDVNSNASMYACAVAVDEAGSKVCVVWNGNVPGSSYDRIFCRERTGAGWGSTEIVSDYSDGTQYDPVVAIRDGVTHVLWRGYTEISPTRQEILYRQKLSGTWGDVMQLSSRSSGANVLNPALAVGLFDDINIAWYDNSDGDNDVYYLRGDMVEVGVAAIIAPAGLVPRGTRVIPQAVCRNFGSHNPSDFRVFCFLSNPGGSRVYAESLDVTGLNPGADTTVVFPEVLISDAGSWTVRCSTAALLDRNPGNNFLDGSFDVYNTDIQMFQIQAPAGTVDSGTAVVPRGRWRNRGALPAGFTAYVKLVNPSGAVVYYDSLVVATLAGHRDTSIQFPAYVVDVTGDWQVRCSTSCINDTFPDNDVRSAGFVVRLVPPWPSGWHEVRQVPLFPSGRPVSDGGWITQMKWHGVRYLFILKGNKVGDFYLYDPIADTWHQLPPMPSGPEARPPRRASVGVAGGDYIYATKGNNTLGFWRYSVEFDTWERLPDVPSATGKRVKAGADMVYIKRPHIDTGYVYLLKGYTDEFYRFNTISLGWETLAPAPVTPTGRRWDRGSWIVYGRQGGNYYIYAHKAKYHELWKYDVLADTWFSQQLRGMPFIGKLGKTKKCKDGSAAAWYNDAIFALKGGNTCEFWRYDAPGDSWVELDTMPSVGSTGKKKRVKGGGDIVLYDAGAFFALKGNKTPELWCYVVADTVFAPAPIGSGIKADFTPKGEVTVAISPNPLGPQRVLRVSAGGKGAVLQIFDVAGRNVFIRAVNGKEGVVNLTGLQAGVYLLKVKGETFSYVGKLVVR